MLQLIDENGNLLPVYEVAADNSVGAGVDEWVLVSRGSAARQVPDNEQRPLDAAVVAIIDTIYIEDRVIYSKKDQYREPGNREQGTVNNKRPLTTDH